MAAGRGGPLTGGRLPWVVVVLGLLATAVWVLPVLISRSHGFALNDEGSYVLSYRWWDVNTRNFTGAQYLYGPVFEALGYSVAGLRLFRLASVLVTHAVFGWAFMSWLQARFPDAVPSRAWVVAGVAVLVAAGGVTYGWLPLSPGYNDVVALGCLAVMAVFFRSWRAVLLTGTLPVGPALVLPLPVLVMVLAKWSSAAVALLFLGLVFFAVAMALRPAAWARFVGAGLVGTGAVVVLFHLLVAPLGTVISPLVEVNRLAAGSSHTAGALLDLYAVGTQAILDKTTVLLLLMAVLWLAGAGLARLRMRTGARWLVAAGPVGVVVVVAAAGSVPWPEGGEIALNDYSAALVALVVATTVAYVVSAFSSPRGPAAGPVQVPLSRKGEVPAVLAMLLLLPVVQAVGSGNPPSTLAVNMAASWLAFILLCAVVTPRATLGRWFAVAAGIATLALCVSVGADGVMLHPYGTPAYDSSDRRLGGTGALGAVAMPPKEVGELRAVRRAMAPTPPGRRPVVALDEVAGLALLTDGRPLGEPWSSANAPDRLAAGIRAACHDDAWTRSDEPIVLAWRSVPAVVTDALAACGVRLDRENYREVQLPVEDRTVRIYTPRG